MKLAEAFQREMEEFDAPKLVAAINERIREILIHRLKRRGLVVGLSGGIDSSVTAALAAEAVGNRRVLAVLMPERHSSPETLEMSTLVARHFGIPTEHEDITPILEAVRFYSRYNKAVRRVIPGYGDGWTSKIVRTNIIENEGFALFSIVALSPDGIAAEERLPLHAYLEIVAATNFKQRIRKMLEYYYADRFNFAVAGTPNRLEYDQGFFVKQGDGAADLKPIAHLYKSQVYKLAEYLGIPETIRNRPPTTDTYSMPQSQDEFYFSLPYRQMDLCLFAKNNGYEVQETSELLGLTSRQTQRVFDDIDKKRSTTRYQHFPPLLMEEIPEIRAR